MICFVLLRNGRVLGRGAVREGVLSADVSWMTGQPGRPAEMRCSLGGLETSQSQQEYLTWVDVEDLAPGDVVTVQVEEGHSADKPTRREAGHQQRREADRSRSLRCSFCDQFRTGPGGAAGVDVNVCGRCRALGAELLDRNESAVFHLSVTSDVDCSFCLAAHRRRAVIARGHAICSKCLGVAE